MQTCPPVYRRETEAEREDRLMWEGVEAPKPKPKKRAAKRSSDNSDVFDVKRWRVPSHWRNDRRVGDVTISKMLRGISMERFERLAAS
jgi:hypothetical protein